MTAPTIITLIAGDLIGPYFWNTFRSQSYPLFAIKLGYFIVISLFSYKVRKISRENRKAKKNEV
jgi:hypothetical protein